jgi:hypothetical protein
MSLTCHDCGEVIHGPAAEVRVKSGGASFVLGNQWGGATHFQFVKMCPACAAARAQQHRKEWRRTIWGLAIVFVITALVVFGYSLLLTSRIPR